MQRWLLCLRHRAAPVGKTFPHRQRRPSQEEVGFVKSGQPDGLPSQPCIDVADCLTEGFEDGFIRLDDDRFGVKHGEDGLEDGGIIRPYLIKIAADSGVFGAESTSAEDPFRLLPVVCTLAVEGRGELAGVKIVQLPCDSLL